MVWCEYQTGCAVKTTQSARAPLIPSKQLTFAPQLHIIRACSKPHSVAEPLRSDEVLSTRSLPALVLGYRMDVGSKVQFSNLHALHLPAGLATKCLKRIGRH
eukprot:4389702-Amphidinium_carterae.1